MLLVIFKLIERAPVSRLIVYHSQVAVQEVAEILVRVFFSKVFLCYDNYFMYSESRKPHYRCMVKPCQMQARLQDKIMM